MTDSNLVGDQAQPGVEDKYPSRSKAPKGYGGEADDDSSEMLDPESTFLTGVALAGEGKPKTEDEAGTMIRGKRSGDAPPKGRTGSLAAETLATMDVSRISFLRKEAQRTASGLDRADFIMTMATCVAGNLSSPVDSMDDIDLNLVAHFCDIFAQVDMDNNGAVSWEELSNFMIEMRMQGWARESEVGVPNYVFTGKIESAQPSQAVEQIRYVSEDDTVVIMEGNANFFRVYDADSMLLKRQFDIQGKVGAARSLCYCTSSGHYVLGTSTSRVCFYEESSGTTWKEFRAPSTPICMAYSESHDMLVYGDMAGNVLSWKLDQIRASSFDDGEVPPHTPLGSPFKTGRPPSKLGNAGKSFGKDGGHSDAVLGLLSLEGASMVASSSMDHTVKLWDLNTLGLQRTLLGHQKGVKYLAYCPEHRLIVSGGYSYDLVISNPYTSSPVSRLRGHCAPIAGVEYVSGTSQLVTADTDGFCKVWDLRTFGCVGTFACGVAERKKRKTAGKTNRSSACQPATRKPTIACMTVRPLSKRIFLGGQSVGSFEIARRGCEELADDMAVRAVYFNATDLTFVTASAWAVEVWDGATGELLCADARQQRSPRTGLTEKSWRGGEIFSMCIGARGRAFVVGDRLGHIKAYNAVNHTVLRTHEYPECAGKSHAGSVRALIFVEDHALLISASADRSISIHDESGRNTGTLLRRTTNASWSEISALRYSHHLGLIASGNNDGSIQLWNFELGRHVGCCHEKHSAPVTCLAFLDPFPILLSADAAGFLVLWALPPARERLRFKRIFTWMNEQPVSDSMYGTAGGVHGQIPVAVTSVECQVEIISASIAVSTVTGSAARTSDSSGDSDESSSLEMSLEPADEEEIEDEEETREEHGGQEQRSNDVDDTATEADSARSPGSTPGVPNDRSTRTTGEDMQDGEHETQHARRCGVDDTPAEGATSRSPAETDAAPGASQDGGRGGGGVDTTEDDGDAHPAWDPSVASPYPLDGGSSRDRSFQERLAATFRKYQGRRQRYPRSEGCSGREQQQQKVMWNTEMLSYTVYTGDESGNVAAWDLKAVIIALIHIFGNHEWAGHGLDPVQSPAVHANAFLIARWDAEEALLVEKQRLGAKGPPRWISDTDDLGLHRIGSWVAHEDPITCMNLVYDPPAVITAAMDRLVKVWSPSGDLQGVLRQKQDPDTPWKFRVNRQAQEDRKLRAAEDVILETKLSPRTKREDRPAADTGSLRGLARRQLFPPWRRCEGHKNAATTEAPTSTASGRTPRDNEEGEAASEKQRGKHARDPDAGPDEHGRNSNGSRDGGVPDGDDDSVDGGVTARGGAGDHEALVDVSRRSARAVRKYAEEELDRFCEGSISSTATPVVGPLRFASGGSLAAGCGVDAAGRSARRTPRRIPVRPNASRNGVTRGGVLQGGFGACSRTGSASPRAARGQLVVP